MMRLMPVMTMVAMVSCPRPAPVATGDGAGEAFGPAAEAFYDALMAAHPGWAVALGWHVYDGRLPDVSQAGMRAEIERLHAAQAQFDAMTGLEGDEELDRLRIVYGIRESLFLYEVRRSPWTNPMYYPGA